MKRNKNSYILNFWLAFAFVWKSEPLLKTFQQKHFNNMVVAVYAQYKLWVEPFELCMHVQYKLWVEPICDYVPSVNFVQLCKVKYDWLQYVVMSIP